MVSSGQTAIGDVKYLVADIAGSVECARLPPTGGGVGLAFALGVVAVGGRQTEGRAGLVFALGVVAVEGLERLGWIQGYDYKSYPLFNFDCISLDSDLP